MTGPRHPELSGDYHVHSTFSDDAVSSLADNISAAARAGLSVIRVTEHVRVSTGWVPEFVSAVAAQPVPDGLTVLTGVEAKILDATGTLDVPAALAGVDAIVIADHQFPGADGPLLPHLVRERLDAGLPVADALDMLVGALVGAMTRAPGNQLAHCFSILPKIGLSEDDLSLEQLELWASTAAQTSTLIEVNEKWDCPGPRALEAAFAAGAVVVASTDAHEASEVGRYERVVDLLDRVRR